MGHVFSETDVFFSCYKKKCGELYQAGCNFLGHISHCCDDFSIKFFLIRLHFIDFCESNILKKTQRILKKNSTQQLWTAT